MDSLEQLKLLLGVTDDTLDTLLSLVIDEVDNYILAYCKRETVPEPLARLVAPMACALWRARGYGASDAPRTVKSVAQGNRTVTYADTGADAYMDVFEPFRVMLNPYRRALTPQKSDEFLGGDTDE